MNGRLVGLRLWLSRGRRCGWWVFGVGKLSNLHLLCSIIGRKNRSATKQSQWTIRTLPRGSSIPTNKTHLHKVLNQYFCYYLYSCPSSILSIIIYPFCCFIHCTLIQRKSLYIIMEQDTLNLSHYVSVLSHLTFRACEIAKDCAENPLLKKYEKGVNDPVTEADYKIQTMLIRGIRHFFPKLHIVGEETTEYEGHIHLDLAAVPLNNFPQTIGCEESHPISDYCVWIDPIDNTKGFINGTLDCVTILVGLSWKKRAELGIIGLPYVRENGKIIYRPEVQVGSVTNKKAFSSLTEGTWNQIYQPKPNNPLKFSISDSRGFSDVIKNLLELFSAQLLRVGGSGKKIIQVAKGQSDALLYLKAANHKWDSCAGEAIVLALGGFFTDYSGSAIEYDPECKSTINQKGNICVIDANLFHSIINQLSKI